MKAGTVLLPREIERPVERLLQSWRDVERQGTPFTLVPMSANQMYEVRRDFGVRAFATHHGGVSLGYCLVSIREKLKPEFLGVPGPELADMKKKGVEIQYRVEVPLITFLGDTTAGPVFDVPDVQNAQVLVTEITFFDSSHRTKAKAGKHLHLDQFVEILPKLKNEHIVISHVSRRTGIRRAKYLLRKRVGDAEMKRIHFLMDFENSRESGDVDSTVPPPPDSAE
jgi:ribonuclease Z